MTNIKLSIRCSLKMTTKLFGYFLNDLHIILFRSKAGQVNDGF